MTDKKKKTSLPFIKAYTFLLEKKELTPAEKLVLIVLCRFWPSPFWGSNSTIALSLGYKVRFVEKIIRRLKIKGYIKTGYAHKIKGGKNHTARVIVPMCFSEKCKLSDFKLDTVQQDGQDTVLRCAQIPSYSTKSAVLQDDLIERNRKENRESTPLPLPVREQAKALKEKMAIPKMRLTEQEFQEKRRKQLKALMESG